MQRAENHIVAAMGISDGTTDFRKVFRDMGIEDKWILTPGQSAQEIRQAFQVFCQSAVRVEPGRCQLQPHRLGWLRALSCSLSLRAGARQEFLRARACSSSGVARRPPVAPLSLQLAALGDDMSLKAVMASILTVLGLLVLAAAGSLGLLTNYLHRVTTSLGTSVEGVRLAEELQVALLTHDRQGALLPPSDSQRAPLDITEAHLQRLLDEMEPVALTPAEQALVRDIRQKVDAYLAAYQDADGAPSALVDQEGGTAPGAGPVRTGWPR